MSSCTDLNILLKFKVRVVERVVEREVVPAHLTQQLAEKDEQIQLLQQELEAEKTGKTPRENNISHPHSSQAANSVQAERRRLRGDVLDKGKTITSLTALNTQLQRDLAEVRLKADLDRKAFKKLHSENKTLVLQFNQRIKDLETNIATKNLDSQESITAIQALEAQLEVAVATAAKQLSDVEQLKQRTKELEEQMAARDSHVLFLDNMVHDIEVEKRKLEEVAALEK
ncbi:hypothetical protein F5877DRAFT_86892, partial [Lentinula edodes]